MRLALKTSPEETTWVNLRTVWSVADTDSLYESAWLYDHMHPVFASPDQAILESWTALAALASATSRLRLGVMVTGTIYRSVSLLAKMACTVDHISGGRLELAVGAGWNADEAKAYGLELGTVRDRCDRFDETMEALLKLLGGGPVDFRGQFVHLEQAYCVPRPVQTPRPPIWIGGTGPRRTLPAAARWADYWNFPVGTVEEFKLALDRLQECCLAIGRTPGSIVPTAQVRHAPEADPALVASEARAFDDAGAELVVIFLDPPYSPLSVEKLSAALQEVV